MNPKIITIEKLTVYKKYRGYYDGFHLQNGNEVESRLFGNGEWGLIDSLVQDINLIKRGLASKEFEKTNDEALIEYCENKEVIDELFTIANYLDVS